MPHYVVSLELVCVVPAATGLPTAQLEAMMAEFGKFWTWTAKRDWKRKVFNVDFANLGPNIADQLVSSFGGRMHSDHGTPINNAHATFGGWSIGAGGIHEGRVPVRFVDSNGSNGVWKMDYTYQGNPKEAPIYVRYDWVEVTVIT